MKRYKYPNSDKVFILDHFDKNQNAHFKCGHWCTNNVFDDLIDLSTGFAKWNNPQLKLKLKI
jgi:hypothetical protein